MRKQTKLVAVLSTAALLAIGASMTSFAATGWAEEDGTWVYYNRDGERATEQWKKSGNNWYYLDSDGEMATDQLIEDGDNYYYVDINGVMASNQWVAIDNEDAGDDNEPDHYWYYFQANGKALKNGDTAKVSLKTVNGKKYAFDDEGRMLYGWVSSDNAERVDDEDGDGFKEGDYYFGGEDDGAMTVGWLQMDITYDETTDDKEVAPVFNDDEDQSRWFYFKSNGKKVKAESNDNLKEKTINGKKYAFDVNGAMIAEWSLDIKKASNNEARGSNSTATANGVPAKYAQSWRYYNSVEDGAKAKKGWFKVVAAEYLNYNKNNDDESAWYYADGSGYLYAGEFKTIKGKKYAFRDDGRMISGLQFIQKGDGTLSVKGDDDDNYPFDTEDDFNSSALWYEANGYKCYYFGSGDDGAMKTNKTNIDIDGDRFNFYFEKSGSDKGAGLTGEKDDKFYQSGKLVTAGKDEKYQIVQKVSGTDEKGYKKLDDIDTFLDAVGDANVETYTNSADAVKEAKLKAAGVSKNGDDIKDLYIVKQNATTAPENFFLVNTSGKVIDSKTKSKDGSDYYIVTKKGGQIVAIYSEN